MKYEHYNKEFNIVPCCQHFGAPNSNKLYRILEEASNLKLDAKVTVVGLF